MKSIKNLLSSGLSNYKLSKNELESYILYLAPYTQNSKGINICPNASAGCILGCLYTAGRGKFSYVQEARLNRANFYINHRQAFLAQLYGELSKLDKKARRQGTKIAVRLNGTSDLDFIGQINKQFDTDILTQFEGLAFYDYTKILGKVKKYAGQNYYLTFSRSETTKDEDIIEALQYGANVSMVFGNGLPNAWKVQGIEVPVLDGDESDIVMMRAKGSILGLKAKGSAKKDKSGFVVNI